jgi:hypothetical protein
MRLVLNKKSVIGLLLLLTIVAISAVILWRRPSAEMIELRKLEQQLTPPKPFSRSENDKGQNTDWKGAEHYDRSIQLEYRTLEDIESVQKKLTNLGWELEETNKSDFEDNTNYWYSYNNGNICVFITIDRQPVDSFNYGMILSIKQDGCNYSQSKN